MRVDFHLIPALLGRRLAGVLEGNATGAVLVDSNQPVSHRSQEDELDAVSLRVVFM